MNYLKQLFWGPPGCGKTVLLGTITDVPELLPNIYVDFEGNTDSIESRCNYLGINEKGFEKLIAGEISETKLNVIRCKCVNRTLLGTGEKSDFTGLDVYYKVLKYILDQDHPFKSGCLDSQTSFDYWMTNAIMARNPGTKRADANVPEWPDYRKLLEAQFDVFNLLNDSDIHLFATCQDYDKVNKNNEIIGHFPRLTGQARTAVTGILKQTVYVNVVGGVRELRFQPYGLYYAKDCSESKDGKAGVFGEKMANPTMRKIYDMRYN